MSSWFELKFTVAVADLWTMDLLTLGVSVSDSSCQRIDGPAATPVSPGL